MTQLLLDAGGYHIALPESQKRGYHADREPLSEDVEMITGRLTRELRGSVWRVSYQYGYLDAETKNLAIAACEKGRRQGITCGFLPPDSDGPLLYSKFLVTSLTYPEFMWSRAHGAASLPVWANFSVELREVAPGD